jgi:hypothetical protein
MNSGASALRAPENVIEGAIPSAALNKRFNDGSRVWETALNDKVR